MVIFDMMKRVKKQRKEAHLDEIFKKMKFFLKKVVEIFGDVKDTLYLCIVKMRGTDEAVPKAKAHGTQRRSREYGGRWPTSNSSPREEDSEKGVS